MENQALVGDCAEVLKKFDDESIDCIVTDPPYGISFMGKEWDKALPSLDALKECNRVLKAGAFGFFMCAPRMDVLWRMGQRLEESGFRVDFSFIGWSYASGFPKASNISKLIEKRYRGPDKIVSASGVGFMNGDNDGYHNTLHRHVYSEIKSPNAIEFNGSYGGFQPKPALECIITVMKPLSEKTYVDQALSNGKGVTWLSDCRIPCEAPHHDEAGRVSGKGFTKQGGDVYYSDPNGRFPANLLVSDNVLDRGVITKSPSGHVNRKPMSGSTFNTETCRIDNTKNHIVGCGDSGDFSRYFSLDTWFEKKLACVPPDKRKTFPFLIVPKPSKSEKNKYIENKHPTVKPLKLMSYLITLGSREGDVILDPFAGSGTTLEACKLLNRVFIGIDKDPENEKYMIARGQLNENTLEAY